MKLCTQRERKTFQRQTTLYLEYRNVFISILVENLLPDLKTQMEDNVVRWVDQHFDVIQIGNQFFEELKITVLFLQI